MPCYATHQAVVWYTGWFTAHMLSRHALRAWWCLLSLLSYLMYRLAWLDIEQATHMRGLWGVVGMKLFCSHFRMRYGKLPKSVHTDPSLVGPFFPSGSISSLM